MSRKRKRDAEIDGLEAELCVINHEMAELEARSAEIQARINTLREENEEDKQDELRSQKWDAGFSWDPSVDSALQKFGHATFRPLQREAINGVLAGNDVFTILPTGAGKSLCFQLPAYHWLTSGQPGVVCIISPLLSLMADQVRSLQDKGLSASMLCSTTTAPEKKAILNKVGDGSLPIVYTTPEFLVKAKTLMAKLQKAYTSKKLRLFVIDEAHCCSTWGHDFRPDYKKLALLRQNFPTVPILALTATATAACARDVTNTLAMSRCLLLKGRYNRANIRYCVMEKPSKPGDDVRWLAKYMTGRWKGRSGIVYCLSCRDVDKLVEALNEAGAKSVGYHAQHTPEHREEAYASWFNGTASTIVATVAFGMGIDKQDVRYVVHHSLPKSVESYYQESGRAGRDGSIAESVVLYKPADVTRLSCLLAESTNREHNLQKLYELARCMDPPEPECRRKAMASYFGDEWKQADCEGHCDFCATQTRRVAADVTSVAQHLLAIAAAAPKDPKLTSVRLCEALYSEASAAKKVRNGGAAPLSGKDRPDPGVPERVVTRMLQMGCLAEEFSMTAYGCNSYIRASSSTVGGRVMLLPFK